MAVVLSLCHSILYALSRTRFGVFQILIINLGAWIIEEERVWIIEVWIFHYFLRILLSVVCVEGAETEESENKLLIIGDDNHDAEYTGVTNSNII